MKTDKFYKARMDGLAYALEIVEKGGVEALKKELKVRNAYFIPMEIYSKKAEELSEMLAHRILATFVPTVMFSLNQAFGFGRDRLLRWKDAFINLCDMMDAVDPFGCQYETVKDYAEELQRKYNIEFDWDSIDEVIGLNQNHKKQLCEIDVKCIDCGTAIKTEWDVAKKCYRTVKEED